MKFPKSGVFTRLVCGLVTVTILGVVSARAGLAWGTATTPYMQLTLIMDDASKKVYMIAAGPSQYWFGWGFGQSTMAGYALIFNSGNSSGNYFECNMDFAVTPAPQAQQDTTASFSVASGTITYKTVRDLQTSDSGDYVFSTANSSIPMVWAIGNKPFDMHFDRSTGNLIISNAPAPVFGSVQRNFGSTILSINSLKLGLTNHIEFVDSLGNTNWTTVSNLVLAAPSPESVTSVSSFLTNLTVSIADANTNAAGFYRVRQ